MEKVWRFAKRHRGKLIVAGVVSAVGAGGLYLVHKLAEAKYKEWKEKEERETLEKVRQQHHFESTWRTGNLTLRGAIFPALLEALADAIKTEEIVTKIKECQILTEKVVMWNQLKEMAFGRCLALIVCSTYLDVLLRCQLSILAGYTYRETVGKSVPRNDQNENRRYLTTNKLSNRVQEKYLSLCQIFIEKAVPLFCTNVLQNVVPDVVKEVALSQAVSVVDIEKYLNSMLSMCDKICNEEMRTLLHSNVIETGDMDESEKEMLDILLGDSIEVLDCQELTGQALHSASVLAFNSTVDKIAERFPSTKSDVEFVSTKVPFAKLIPVLSGLVIPSPDENPEDFWLFSVHSNSSNESVKTFALNIYQSFSTSIASYQ